MAASVYLFTGPEFGEKNDKIDSLKSELQQKFGDVEFYRWYASENSIVETISQLQSGSLFSSASCVILREAELIKKKDELEELEKWIQSSSDSQNVLILVSDEISVDSKLDKLISPANKKVFWGMDENHKEDWIRNFFKKGNFGVCLGIEDDAISLILEMIENDTASLKSECSRFFFCFPNGHVLSVGDVEKILAHNREESAFTLFESMTDLNIDSSKRLEVALSIVQKISLTKNSSPVLLIAGLTSCFRKLSLWHSIHSAGVYLDDFALKTKGFTSKKMRMQYSRASKIWNFGQTAAIIALLSESDMEMRSSGSVLQNIQIFKLIYEIIIKKGIPCSKYEGIGDNF